MDSFRLYQDSTLLSLITLTRIFIACNQKLPYHYRIALSCILARTG